MEATCAFVIPDFPASVTCFILNGSECQDMDECHDPDDTPCPENSFCNNTVGSFFCMCSPGYKPISLVCTNLPGERQACIDTNECYYSPCHPLARCWNTPGSYLCQCPTGFTGNGSWCKDVDECVALPTPCHPLAQCHNTPGSFVCVCKEGFMSVGTLCVDIDECLQTDGQCPSVATCINYVGGFQCSCNHGWDATSENEHGKGGCVDVDECVSLLPCPGQSSCVNLPGSHASENWC
uniref:EGF-like domain-containing protein n=1 Tax=Acanthochromis polyacanthus TaxID=80966 RepID=A0A3Q1FLS7_9TELE